MKTIYQNIFQKVGIGHLTYLTFASGGSFSKYSHEFQTVTPVGEDTIYLDKKSGIAINKEVYNDEVVAELKLNRDNLTEERAVEVGNIFSLGIKFSTPFDLKYRDEKGKEKLVVMGSYGIGLGRLMGTIVEVLSDSKGIVWPENVAPFKVHLLSLGENEEAEKIYKNLLEKEIEVLYDDREVSAGEKFADSDLIGIPYRVVVSKKSLAAGGVEMKKRNSEKSEIIKIKELTEIVK